MEWDSALCFLLSPSELWGDDCSENVRSRLSFNLCHQTEKLEMAIKILLSIALSQACARRRVARAAFIDARDRAMQRFKIINLLILELVLCSSAILCPAYRTS